MEKRSFGCQGNRAYECASSATDRPACPTIRLIPHIEVAFLSRGAGRFKHTTGMRVDPITEPYPLLSPTIAIKIWTAKYRSSPGSPKQLYRARAKVQNSRLGLRRVVFEKC